MFQTRQQGTPLEMGRQLGLGLKQAGMKLGPPKPKVLRFARRCEELVAQHAPELLEELRGLAEASEQDYDAVLAVNLTAPFDPQELPACTVLAVSPERSADGRPIVGRNYDFFYDVSGDVATTCWTYPTGHYAHVGDSDIWVGRDDGLNEAGLFVGIASIFLEGMQPGIVFWLVVRMLLDRCATVDEGLDLLHKVPHIGSWTYLLADRTGKAAAVETGMGGVEVRCPQDGLLVITNHPLCPRYVDEPAFVPADSRPRYDRLHELLGGARKVNVEAVKQALRDHQGLVCSHGAHFPKRRFGTLWSAVGRPGERWLDIAAGNPCTTKCERRTF